MTRYLAVAVAILSFIVIDQCVALHRLAQFSEEQGRIVDDYYSQLRHCDDVFESVKNCADPAECIKRVHW